MYLVSVLVEEKRIPDILRLMIVYPTIHRKSYFAQLRLHCIMSLLFCVDLMAYWVFGAVLLIGTDFSGA